MGVLLSCHRSNTLASRKQYSGRTKAVLLPHESIETVGRKEYGEFFCVIPRCAVELKTAAHVW